MPAKPHTSSYPRAPNESTVTVVVIVIFLHLLLCGIENEQHIVFDCPLYESLRTEFKELFKLAASPQISVKCFVSRDSLFAIMTLIWKCMAYHNQQSPTGSLFGRDLPSCVSIYLKGTSCDIHVVVVLIIVLNS